MLQAWIDMAGAAGITMPDFEATAVLRRLSDPREQATVIAFLLLDEASYITAVDIPVDGGTILLNRGMPSQPRHAFSTEACPRRQEQVRQRPETGF